MAGCVSRSGPVSRQSSPVRALQSFQVFSGCGFMIELQVNKKTE